MSSSPPSPPNKNTNTNGRRRGTSRSVAAASVALRTNVVEHTVDVDADAAQAGVDQDHDGAYRYPEWHNMAAGAAAGLGARCFTAPLDMVKIRRQILDQQQLSRGSSCRTGSGGLFQTMSSIVREEGGVRGLFRGNLAATYLWVGYTVVQFALYGRLSNVLASYTPPSPSSVPAMLRPYVECRQRLANNPPAVAFLAGASAGVSATLSTYPFDICRTAFASAGVLQPHAPRTSLLRFTTAMFKERGLGGFYAGSMPAVVSIVPYMGLNFALYDAFTRLLPREESRKITTAGAAGTVAGGMSKLIVYPMDTVKKRLQAQSFLSLSTAQSAAGAATVAGRSGANAKAYDGMIDCIVRVAREEGYAAFYRGLVPNTLKTMAATGLTFAFFTMAKNGLEQRYDDERKHERAAGHHAAHAENRSPVPVPASENTSTEEETSLSGLQQSKQFRS